MTMMSLLAAKRPAAGGGGFDYGDLTNLSLLLDASESTSFTYHSGVRISQWADLSGAGNHAAQATSTNAPAYDTTLGVAAVRFDQFPNATWLSRTGTDFWTGSSLTIMGVWYQETGSSGRIIGMRASGGQDWSAATGAALGSESGNHPSGYRNGAIAGSGSFISALDVYGWRFDGTNSYAYANTTEYGPTSQTGSFAVDEYRLAGAPQGGESSWCYICEMVVCQASLSSTVINDYTSHLISKWSL